MSLLKTFFSSLTQQSRDSTRTAMLRATFIGLVAGLGALGLEFAALGLSRLRLWASSEYPAWIVLPLCGLLGGLISGFLVQKYSPTAYGSGIPQVRAFLLGARQPLDLKLAFVKLIAGSIALGSGLVMGREGPTVHVGAAIAAQVNKWFPANKEHEKQLVAAGAGAGLAAAFNAPIAGVLFVAEELLKDVSTNTIGTAILACFVASAITHILQAPHMETSHQIQSTMLQFSWFDILFWIVLGVLSGVLGTLFNHGVLAFLRLYRERIKIPVSLRVGLAGLISGAVIALFPVTESFRNFSALTDLIVAGQTSWVLSLIAFVAFFFLTLLAYGSGAPGGLFAPSLILGASLGSLVAYMEHQLFGRSSEQTMAMVGMGAFFAAVARVPITAVVIITEITHHYNLVPPLMVTAAIACFVGSRIDKSSVYDLLREYSGLDEEIRRLRASENQTRARNLMKPASTCLSMDSTHEELLLAIRNLDLAGLPVLEGGKFAGIIETGLLMKDAQILLSADVKLKDLLIATEAVASPESTLEELERLFDQCGASTLAVLEGEELKGLLHREDLNTVLAVKQA